MVIVFSSRFELEIRQIHSFIANDSLGRANAFIEKNIDKIMLLKTYPNLGRIVNEDIRELIYKKYVIPYHISNDTIVILGIYKRNIWKV